ncbi:MULTISPECIES: peptidylprolyl isomerase [Terrisporobacter]|uniref:Peptidylprolyl isomerase n=1 Tax=Terrisporobacter othiniensis TaxID=1577792 RepID=A0A0B3W1E1_9FIRM|nr:MULTISPECIES: peptidylprolyl isomerase [Terrisporobacter]KHS56102.1 peptidylprolyl isomerase [Terrisporobacter othiniensis]MCC3668668.1 peptidylprolyl isomerase [Terrisporobacter mayombei]MDU6984213.1 peptidylprolyl isomerase [Terrisporobacter othiniensis]
MKKIVLMGLTILISTNMVACSNKTVAKINDVDVSKEEYKKTEEFLYATGYVEKNEKNSDKVNNDILSFIIDNEVAYQEAQKENIKVKDSDVNEKVEQLKETLENNTSYKEKLESAGITEDFLKEQVKKDLTVAKYKENFIKDIKVTDKEMEAYYNNNKDQFNVKEVKASQILISTLDEDNKEVSKEQKEKLKEKAQSILDKVNNNEDFASLAKKYSDDKNSGKDGGDLGYFAKNEKNIEFTKEVFKLDTNQVSNLIETPYGYHIVKVTDKTTVTKSLEDSKDDIKAKILNEKYTKHIDSLYKKGKITIT